MFNAWFESGDISEVALPQELNDFSDDFLYQAVQLGDGTVIVHVYIQPGTPRQEIRDFFDIVVVLF